MISKNVRKLFTFQTVDNLINSSHKNSRMHPKLSFKVPFSCTRTRETILPDYSDYKGKQYCNYCPMGILFELTNNRNATRSMFLMQSASCRNCFSSMSLTKTYYFGFTDFQRSNNNMLAHYYFDVNWEVGQI